MSSPVLVIGGTSKIGRSLVPRLTATAVPVRALARSQASQATLAGLGAQPVRGDLADPGSLAAAMEGARAVFLLAPPRPDDVAWNANAIDAAARARVGHLVRLSVLGADPASPARMARQHGENDRRLQRSGVPHTILRPNYFAQNVVEVIAPSVDGAGNFYGSAGDARISMVDTDDVAAAAARVLTEPDAHAGAVYELTGPEAPSYADVAATLSRLTGRTVTAVDVPDDATRQALLGLGVDSWTVEAVVELFQSYRASGPTGWTATVTDTIRDLTGSPARSLDGVLRAARLGSAA